MPAPTVRDVHLETALARVSIAYKNEGYIADQVFPKLSVQKQSDYYFIFDKGAWFRDEVARRAPGTRAARADYTLSTASYICIGYALAKSIPDEVRANADQPLRPDVEATEFVTDALLRSRERRVAAKVMTHTGWAYSASPTTQWSSDTSDPFGDIETAISNIINTIGRRPNTAVMSWDVWSKLKQHPDLIDRIRYVRPSGRVEIADISGWFDIPKVLVGATIYDAAQEGATASLSQIWGDDFFIGYVPPSPALMTPAAGYVLEWETRKVARFREEQERQDVVEASENVAEVVTASDAGGIIFNVV